MKAFLQRWAITTLGVLVAAHLVAGIHYDTVAGLLVASLLLGALNAGLRPVLIMLSLPLVILSLGLFMLLINAGLLYFVGQLVKSFHVATFGAAFWGALVVSLVSLVANSLTGSGDARFELKRRPASPRRPPDDRGGGGGGSGPIIDV